MTDTEIIGVDAWEALDSRGRPTVACRVTVADGTAASITVPSGASTGRHEAHELRDGGERYEGLGTMRAAANAATELRAAVVGLQAEDTRVVDDALRATDGTEDLSRLGANAVLSVSVAALVASAASRGLDVWEAIGGEPLLPLPMVNVISGGAHAGRMLDVQDLLVIPVGAQSFAEAIEWAGRARRGTARAAEARGLSASLVADEGGIAVRLPSNRAAFELLSEGVDRSGLQLGHDIAFAIDVAATQFHSGAETYRFDLEDRTLSSVELVDEIASWCRDFPIVSVEDPLGEDDWDGWAYASTRLKGIQLLGDDLFVTQLDRLEMGRTAGVGNAVLVKVNQNGTVSGGLDVVARAREIQYAAVVSARSGETEDSWLADIAVGSRAGQLKVGSTMRSERTAKWNRVLEIERGLAASGRAEYAGAGALAG